MLPARAVQAASPTDQSDVVSPHSSATHQQPAPWDLLMSSYTAEMLHGLDRASPPSPRHPKPRWQVRYRDGTRERSAGIYTSPKAAETVRKRVERGLPALVEAPAEDVDTTKAQTLFGDYVERVWAHVESAAPRLGLPDRQADREAHPAHPRQPSLCRPGCRPDRRVESQPGRRRAQTQQRQ